MKFSFLWGLTLGLILPKYSETTDQLFEPETSVDWGTYAAEEADPYWDTHSEAYYWEPQEEEYYDERIPQKQAGWADFTSRIRNGVSNAGRTVVDAFRRIPTPGQAIERIADRFFGSYPRSVQQFLQQHGDKPMSNLAVFRAPVSKGFQTAVEAVDGDIRRQLDKHGYDNFWHVWLAFTVDGKQYGLDKNSLIRIFEGSKPGASLSIPSRPGITMNSLLSNAIKQKGENRILNYHPVNANCQHFLRDVLSVAGLLPSNVEEFFYQDANRFMKSSTLNAGRAASVGTRVAGWLNRAVQHVTNGRVVMYQDEEE
jgi:hypothetical protein